MREWPRGVKKTTELYAVTAGVNCSTKLTPQTDTETCDVIEQFEITYAAFYEERIIYI